jgi:hypothetical protein
MKHLLKIAQKFHAPGYCQVCHVLSGDDEKLTNGGEEFWTEINR